MSVFEHGLNSDFLALIASISRPKHCWLEPRIDITDIPRSHITKPTSGMSIPPLNILTYTYTPIHPIPHLLSIPSPRMLKLIEQVIDEHELVLCSHIMDELHEVIERKFPHKKKVIEDFLTRFPFEYFYTPLNIDASRYPVIRDKKDLPILMSAIMSDVDIIVTGDKDYFEVEIDKPKILTPVEFLEKY